MHASRVRLAVVVALGLTACSRTPDASTAPAAQPYMARVLERTTFLFPPELKVDSEYRRQLESVEGMRYDEARHALLNPTFDAKGFVVAGDRRSAVEEGGFVTIAQLPKTTKELALASSADGKDVRARAQVDPRGFGVTARANAPTILFEIVLPMPGPMD